MSEVLAVNTRAPQYISMAAPIAEIFTELALDKGIKRFSEDRNLLTYSATDSGASVAANSLSSGTAVAAYERVKTAALEALSRSQEEQDSGIDLMDELDGQSTETNSNNSKGPGKSRARSESMWTSYQRALENGRKQYQQGKHSDVMAAINVSNLSSNSTDSVTDGLSMNESADAPLSSPQDSTRADKCVGIRDLLFGNSRHSRIFSRRISSPETPLSAVSNADSRLDSATMTSNSTSSESSMDGPCDLTICQDIFMDFLECGRVIGLESIQYLASLGAFTHRLQVLVLIEMCIRGALILGGSQAYTAYGTRLLKMIKLLKDGVRECNGILSGDTPMKRFLQKSRISGMVSGEEKTRKTTKTRGQRRGKDDEDDDIEMPQPKELSILSMVRSKRRKVFQADQQTMWSALTMIDA